MLSPKNVIFTDSLLPMKGFPQRVPLIFHYRITGGHRQILLYALHSRKLFSSFTFRFHTLRATYRCLCSELIYHDPGRLYGGNGEEMHLYTNQPYLHFFFLFFYFIIFSSTNSCVMLPYFNSHRTVMNRGWEVGFYFSIIFTLTQRAAFHTPIFNILRGLTGILRRSINGYAKQAIYRGQI